MLNLNSVTSVILLELVNTVSIHLGHETLYRIIIARFDMIWIKGTRFISQSVQFQENVKVPLSILIKFNSQSVGSSAFAMDINI